MASNSNIDIEGATQHLRDILKLDRPGNGTGKLNREWKAAALVKAAGANRMLAS